MSCSSQPKVNTLWPNYYVVLLSICQFFFLVSSLSNSLFEDLVKERLEWRNKLHVADLNVGFDDNDDNLIIYVED